MGVTREVSVADYLAERLRQHGVAHLFGVPGDSNLELLDRMLRGGQQRWIGSANELSAGCAADAYARRRGLAAVVTTSGVGELSCLTAIAGAYAEQVPVVQITGAPPTGSGAALLRHTLADGDPGHFARAYREVTAATEVLTHASAASQIDHALATAVATSRPVYLSVPADVASAPVDAHRLATPVWTEPVDAPALAAFANAARALLRAKDGQVTVIAGHGVERRGATRELRALVEAGPLPFVTLVSSKGAIDEDHPCFAGVYCGDVGVKSARRAVDQAAVLITVGTLMTDTVAGAFTAREDPAHTIDVRGTTAVVAGEVFEGVPMRAALAALTGLAGEYATLPAAGLPASAMLGRRAEDEHGPVTDALTQISLWESLEEWLPASSTLLTEVGTSFWGAVSITFPPNTAFVGQPVWSSPGYTLPATLGAGLAEPGRRPVLVIGDGAAQTSAPELGTIASSGLTPVVIVVNNAGRTGARVQRSPEALYHDVTPWNWSGLVRSVAPNAHTYRATSRRELRQALAAAGAAPEKLVFIEAVLPSADAPPMLKRLASNS
ncbi:alpha-keto acid decarboxylase family protein [Cryptosporangium phraense]|uniref:Alpha-keto-acid decarboxylase n=1 Tax=Cryptosporangium phraense TaxID=2593070 RepID=A0A545AER5_9ACTN|nr:thiamine pyrophosphate-binding protein [Cryptosporangium phraense]TQS39826.1 alpha-keto acid decarboxylase family protein [Cryptosporangium phraense]